MKIQKDFVKTNDVFVYFTHKNICNFIFQVQLQILHTNLLAKLNITKNIFTHKFV